MISENIKKANKIKIETVIKNLKKRNITGHYADSCEEALCMLLEMIPEGSLVGKGGSHTLDQVGITKVLAEGNYEYLDSFNIEDPDVKKEMRRKCFSADFFLCSANAVTMDGIIVNIDGVGNRVAATIWGPDKVIFVVGANKLVASKDEAVARIKQDACPPNCIRLGRKTPCSVTGVCADCTNPEECICCHTVETRLSSIDDRMHVIFVNENLGF